MREVLGSKQQRKKILVQLLEHAQMAERTRALKDIVARSRKRTRKRARVTLTQPSLVEQTATITTTPRKQVGTSVSAKKKMKVAPCILWDSNAVAEFVSSKVTTASQGGNAFISKCKRMPGRAFDVFVKHAG